MAPTHSESGASGELDFEQLVERHYAALYRFALSLTRAESEAADLTQEAFHLWAMKGRQLRDPTRVKTWLFTTLHRLVLGTQRRRTRFPHHHLESVEQELPAVGADLVSRLDGQTVLELLSRVDDVFQAPVALFYLEDLSYKEIADVLGVPLGTVKSRIARGLAQLQALVHHDAADRTRAPGPTR